ncbi:MAG: DUF4113 domain-containing protein [Gallionella sp.]|nr:DUF4113 domain-containing protein [Gallionella sp.]
MNSINHSFGKSATRLCSEGTEQRWRMCTNHKSPNYTTRITDLAIARAGWLAFAQTRLAALRACLMQMIAFTRWLASCLILVSWDSVSSTMSASQSWAKAFSFDNVYP